MAEPGELDLSTVPGTDEFIAANAGSVATGSALLDDKGNDDKGGGEDKGGGTGDASQAGADDKGNDGKGGGGTGDGGSRDQNIMIPKARFDQVLAQNRRMQAEMQESRERMARLEGHAQASQKHNQEPPYDFADANKRKWEAATSGKMEDAMRIDAEIEAERDKIRQAREDEYRQEVTRTATRDAQAQVAQQAMYEKFPQLDRNSDQFNPEAFAFAANYIQGAANAEGADVGQVIADGAQFAAMKFGFAEAGGGGGSPGGLADAAGASGAADAAADKQGNAQNKADAARRQPDNLNRTGQGSGSQGGAEVVSIADIVKLQDKDMDALQEAGKWAEMRGDNYAPGA